MEEAGGVVLLRLLSESEGSEEHGHAKSGSPTTDDGDCGSIRSRRTPTNLICTVALAEVRIGARMDSSANRNQV